MQHVFACQYKAISTVSQMNTVIDMLRTLANCCLSSYPKSNMLRSSSQLLPLSSKKYLNGGSNRWGFQKALLLKGLKLFFERPWQCAIFKL
jgi:hypothetical protein